MSYADLVFKNMCQDILENGTDTRGEKVRPHWPMVRRHTQSKNSAYVTGMTCEENFRR